MERQLRDAGLGIAPVKAAPGDAIIAATGATAPSGVPIADEDFARLIEGPKRHKRAPGGARGPRAGSRGGYRPHHGAGHDERRGSRGERADRGDRAERRYRGPRDGEPLIGRWGDENRARDRRRPRS
jgi:hypothetical protein